MIHHLECRQIAISQRKLSDFDEIWYTTANLEPMTARWPNMKIEQNHNTPACSIYWKPFLAITLQPVARFKWNFVWGSNFSIEVRQWDRCPRTTFFVSLMQFGLRRAAAFVSSPIQLLFSYMLRCRRYSWSLADRPRMKSIRVCTDIDCRMSPATSGRCSDHTGCSTSFGHCGRFQTATAYSGALRRMSKAAKDIGYTASQKNAPTSASCSFDKNWTNFDNVVLLAKLTKNIWLCVNSRVLSHIKC